MTRREIAEGLAAWERLQQLAAHSTRYMDRAAARSAQEPPASGKQRGS